MKATKLSLAIASLIGAGFAGQALALDLYVDNKTQQIFAEPGPNRSKLGSFEKVEETAAQKAEIAKIKEDMALKTNEMKALDEHMQAAEETKLKMGPDGVSFESKDGNFKMKVVGRVQMDAQTNVGGMKGVTNTDGAGTSVGTSNQLADGAGLRRARIGVEGSFYKDFGYKVEYDFAGSAITDAYLNYLGLKDFNFQAGQFKEPYGMEIQTSNRFIPFIERSMMSNAFSDSQGTYQGGFGVAYADPRWTAKAAIQTANVAKGWDQTTGQGAQGGDSSYQLAGRFTALPWFKDKTHLVHLGTSAMYRQTNVTDGSLQFKASLGGNIDRSTVLTTSSTALTGSGLPRSLTRFGGEFATVYGPFAAMAEYTQVDLSGGTKDGTSYSGYYGYATYMLTGESRNYKATTGSWDRIKPARNFDLKGGLGAWELAVGYDSIDLKDKSMGFASNSASLAKAGINWYPNPRFKIMANYVHALHVDSAQDSTGKYLNNTNPDIVEMRAQVDF